jgi:hypothetical protein
MMDLVEARARALGAVRAIERRDIILDVSIVWVCGENAAKKEGERPLQLMGVEEVGRLMGIGG